VGVLLLVRHGQASLGTADYDQLSELGHRQARATGARLARADLVVDRVACGTLARQRDTAAAALAELSPLARGAVAGTGRGELRLRIDGRLDEYDHGALLAAGTAPGAPGVSFETVTSAEANRELQPTLEAAIARWAAGDAGDAGSGESHDAFTGRVEAVMAELTREPGCTVAVTSGGVIAVACVQALGLPADLWPALARVIVNGSITKFISGRTGTNLVTFNDHAHLEDDRSLISYR
jgi:broad specificity phosphatase PhoE